MDFASLLAGKNITLMGGVFALTTTFRLSFKPFFESGLGERLMPLLPLLLGVAGAFLGMCENAPTGADKTGIGLVAGFAAGHLFKLGKTSVMGYGITPKTSKSDAEEPAPDGDKDKE